MASISLKELEKLAKDKKADVREAVAKNKNTPTSVLEKLAKDKNKDVRYAVAGNLNTPASPLEKLVYDDDEYVCSSAIANANTPITLLEKLAELRAGPRIAYPHPAHSSTGRTVRNALAGFG